MPSMAPRWRHGGSGSGPHLPGARSKAVAALRREAVLFFGWKAGWCHPLTRSVLVPPEAPSTPPGPQPHAGRLRVSGRWVGRQAPPPLPGPGSYLTWAAPPASEAWRSVLQAQQLSHESLPELGPAVPLHMVGLRHLVQDVGVIDGNAYGKPEHLLPGLVWFMRNEIPTRTERQERLAQTVPGGPVQERHPQKASSGSARCCRGRGGGNPAVGRGSLSLRLGHVNRT